MNKKELGIYVHIPFCKHKCYYCDFTSYANKTEYIKKYVEAVIKEIKTYDLKEYSITTIYLGGGTPSYIESKYIKKLLEALKNQFDIENDCEITIEVNPGTVTEDKLEKYKKCGINRLSVGLQSINDKLLKQIGRIHNYKQLLKTYDLARKIGFDNINVDLIIGIPNQTMKDIEQEMDEIIKLEPEHISTYSLIVEEGTPLEKQLQEGKYKLPKEDLEREMYWYIKKVLERKGYQHYEISNFSKEGKESRHNKNCWEQKEYIGLGVASHSYLNNIRYSNTENLEKYIENIEDNKMQLNRIVHEKQTEADKEKEFILLGLRKIDGVSIKSFKEKFDKNPLCIFKEELDKLEKQQLIKVMGDDIILTDKGIDLANLVWEEFV